MTDAYRVKIKRCAVSPDLTVPSPMVIVVVVLAGAMAVAGVELAAVAVLVAVAVAVAVTEALQDIKILALRRQGWQGGRVAGNSSLGTGCGD